jgi:hypothetical protein
LSKACEDITHDYFLNSPKVLEGGIVLIDPEDTSTAPRIITLQYNSDTLTRTLASKGIKESGDRSEAMRLTGARGGDHQTRGGN